MTTPALPQAKAITRAVRISAFKVREVTRAIQGMSVHDAVDRLRFWPRKGAAFVAKTLKSAMANAENNHGMRVDNLIVKEAVVGEGPTFKRFQPKARGSAGPVRKRTSHIHITLAERPPETAAKKPARASGSKKASKSKTEKPAA